MSELSQAQARANAELQDGMSRREIGVCVSIVWADSLVRVKLGGGVVDMPMAGALPASGDRVWIAFLGNLPVCLGPIPKPTTGTISGATKDGKVPVEGDDEIVYTIPYTNSYTPDPGDRVAIDWGVPGGFVLGRLSSDAVLDVPPPAPGPAPLPAPAIFEATFNPTDSGTFGSRWQSTEVWASDSTLGAYFYGGQIASTIPDHAAIEAVSLYVVSYYDLGNPPNVGIHTSPTKGGAPAFMATAPTPGGTGWKPLPAQWGDVLKTGAASGVGFAHGGYHKFRPAGYANSGALAIRWRA
jgi:hypothetical protein